VFLHVFQELHNSIPKFQNFSEISADFEKIVLNFKICLNQLNQYIIGFSGVSRQSVILATAGRKRHRLMQ
jgi:hypothetical protein